MPDAPGVGLFHFDDPADLQLVRDALAAAGYDDEGVVRVLGPDVTAALGSKRLPALLRRTAGGTALETLVRLFILGVPVERDVARDALALMALEWWAERGLVRLDGGEVAATVQLRCYQGLVVAFDFHKRGGAPLPADYVMGISASSLALAGMTVRRPARAVLDLGTGSGFQAFFAAQHSGRVVATDRNPRAVEMARFSAALNGLAHVDCREGDLFEPVEGERFDLIVSNPPFIISPDNLYYFLHSGMQGDEICRSIVRQAPQFLEEGGFCQFLANWAVGGRRGLAGPARGLVRRNRLRCLGAPAGQSGARRLRRRVDRDRYRRPGAVPRLVPRVDGLLRTPRHRSHRQRVDHVAPGLRRRQLVPGGGCPGDHVVPVRGRPGPGLRAARLPPGPGRRPDAAGHRLPSQPRRPPGSALRALWWRLGGGVAQLRRVEGLHQSGSIDVQGAQALARCDGTRPLGDVLAELAASLDTDFDTIAPTWLAIVRALVEQGFLLPA